MKMETILRARHLMRKRLCQALDGLGFCEVRTPVRQGKDLRACMELHLRAHLASLPAVYEIGPCFRDDKPDKTHLDEFEMLELFWNRPSFDLLLSLSHDLLESVFQRVLKPFSVVDLAEELPKRFPGFRCGLSLDALKRGAAKYLPVQKLVNCHYPYEVYNLLIDTLVDELQPGTLDQPAIVTNYPAETICVAKPQDNRPELIQRTEIFVNGLEIGHGFVDDMDANRVAHRMNENGPEYVDESFLRLLKAGHLPASSGVGFGLDRLLMLKLGLSDIRQCVQMEAA